MTKRAINETNPEKSTASYTGNKVEKANLKGDWLNLYLLVIFYTMQGFPYGISLALPIIFQSKKVVTYEEQALFSIVLWPYTIKLLWAPIVDAIYIQWIGKRKSWIIPVEFLSGIIFLYVAHNVDEWLPETGKPNIKILTYVFFVMNMLAATQDIAVDAWALTLLKENNVSYGSTCNWTGFSLGIVIGFVCPGLFTSESFCNKHLRFTPSPGGIITEKDFFYCLGVLFLIITTLVAVLKKEKDNRLEDNYVKINVLRSYKLVWEVFNLHGIKILAIAVMTMRFGFSGTYALSDLKLMDAGLSKDDITLISTVSKTVTIFIPLVVTKYTMGPKPMSLSLKVIFARLFWSLLYVAIVYYTPMMLMKSDGIVHVPIYYYFLLGLISVVNEALSIILLTSVQAFFNRISDPRFGGTYLTLLTTLKGLGYFGSSTVALRMVNILTFAKCSVDTQNSCSTPDLSNSCKANGGDCITILDGYYVEAALCLVIGLVWYGIFNSVFKNFQKKDRSYWLVNVNPSNARNDADPIIMISTIIPNDNT